MVEAVRLKRPQPDKDTVSPREYMKYRLLLDVPDGSTSEAATRMQRKLESHMRMESRVDHFREHMSSQRQIEQSDRDHSDLKMHSPVTQVRDTT